MRILQVISYLYPAWSYGGPGKLVYDLSLALAKRGHQVTVCSTDAFDQDNRRGAQPSPFSKESGIQAHFFRNFSNRLAYRYKFFVLREGYETVRKQISHADIVHTHEFFTPLTIATSHFANKAGVPFVISAHGTLDVFHLRHKQSIKNLFMKVFGNKILHNTSALIAATKEEVEEYMSLGINKEKISLVRNGINIREFAPLPQKGKFRKKYSIPFDAKVLLYIGRINPLKGLEMLVEGFAKLKKNNSYVLIIGGSDDGYLDEIKERVREFGISDNVIFPGKIFGAEKLEAFVDSDIFVYPSPSEGFSIAILEAGAAGLPLLITEGCKFPEVEKYRAGSIVPYDDVVFAKTAKKLLEDEVFLKQAGKNAKKLVSDQFTMVKMAERLENIYNNL